MEEENIGKEIDELEQDNRHIGGHNADNHGEP